MIDARYLIAFLLVFVLNCKKADTACKVGVGRMKSSFDLKKIIDKKMTDTEGLSKEEIRRRRKKMEQMQAYGVIAGGVLLLLIVVVLIVKLVSGGFHKEQSGETAGRNEPAKRTEKSSAETEVDEEKPASAAEQVKAAKKAEEEKEQSNPEIDRAALLDEAIAGYIAGMTLEDKAAALFFVTPEQLTNVSKAVAAGGTTSEALSMYPVGGILFSEKNIVDGDQFLEMISNMRTYCKYETFMGISDEGGQTSPFAVKKLIEEAEPSQSEIGASGGVAEAYSSGIAYGTRMRAYGLDVNFAPVADVTILKNASIAKRTYGDNVETVASLAKNTMKGMTDQSIRPVLKYFPGYGDVRGDGSTGRVSSKRTMEDLQNTEGVIYKQLIDSGAEMIMVSTVSMPEITGDNAPACFSEEIVTDYLRGELGFEGVVMTDYVSKSAVSRTYKQSAIAVQAIMAGCDMIVSPSNFRQEYQGVLDAVEDGTITEERLEESIYRIYRVKYKDLVNYGEG